MVPARLLLVPLALLAVACQGSDSDPGQRSVATTSSAAPTTTTPNTIAPAPSTTAPSPSSTTTSPTPAGPETVETVIGRSTIRFTYPAGLTTEEREVLDTYHRFLRGLLSSTDPPNPDDADLAATMEANYLAKERARVEQMRLTGQYSLGLYEATPTVGSPAPDGASRIQDCALDRGVRYSATGQVISPAVEKHTLVMATLEKTVGTWRVRSWIGTDQACRP